MAMRTSVPLVPGVRAGYLRGLPDVPTVGPWIMPVRPVIRDAQEDVRQAWAPAAARATDAMHNDGWISGVVNALVALMIGEGLRLSFKPDLAFTGWDEKTAGEWTRLAERRFASWAEDPHECDAGGRFTLAQQQAAVVRSWFATGEAWAEIPSIDDRPGSRWRTKVRLIPSHWISQRTDANERMVQGVILDRHGAPAGYLIDRRVVDGHREEVRYAARDGYGRPKFVHAFDPMSVGTVRGITPLAPVLRTIRDLHTLGDTTLQSEMIRSIFAATVESDYPTAEVLAAMQTQDEATVSAAMNMGDDATRFDAFMGAKAGWAENVDIDLGKGSRIAHLMLGEKLKLQGGQGVASNYETLANFLLREVARCAGAAFHDLTGDFRNETYSSVRMGIAKQWPLLLYRRKHIPVPFSQAAFSAWLEEEIDSGALPLPGGIDAFVANRSAISRAEWRGPAKPQADEVKAATAHEKYRNMGVMTDEQICDDLGVNYEDVYEQRGREKRMREASDIHGGITNGGTDIDVLPEPGEPGAEGANNAGA